MSPRSRPDESPEVIAINARIGVPGSSPDATDANSIPPNGEEISCSCLGVVGVSMVKFAWIRRVVVGSGVRSHKVGRQ